MDNIPDELTLICIVAQLIYKKNGTWQLSESRPCVNCSRVLYNMQNRISKIIYSTKQNGSVEFITELTNDIRDIGDDSTRLYIRCSCVLHHTHE